MKSEWKTSLHGGHSSGYCDHAHSTLREMLDAAVASEYYTFGVSEHIPRPSRFLYPNELKLGWTEAKIAADFTQYTLDIDALAREYAGRLTVLRGFEAEVVPGDDYVEMVQSIGSLKLPDGTAAFDYFVGSVHYVLDYSIDGEVPEFQQAVAAAGGLEALGALYYQKVAEMAEALKPDVVGHLDLIKKRVRAGGYDLAALETPAVHAAADHALESVRSVGGILDLNTAGWRKGLGEPYPSPRLVARANEIGIPFCFGDDSHSTADVGAGIEAAREYLLENGVDTVTILTREGNNFPGTVVRRTVPLR